MKDANNILMKFISTQGYKRNSPDVNNPVNVIPSNKITMKGVDFPVKGVDNLGNEMVMMPGGEYNFPGNYVVETPVLKKGGQTDPDINCNNCGWSWKMSNAGSDPLTCHKCGSTNAQVEMKNGGQHGGLDRWFAEKWVDVKTGKECGRQEGEKRAGYPACRPSKRVSKDTPKTASELSSSEKEKFKKTKTSSERIPYQHKRKDQGGIIYNDMEYNTDMEFMKEGGNVPTNPELWSRAKSAAKAKYDVYPSAYANGFAAKWYKERGGGWRKKAEMGGCMECGGQMEEGGEQAAQQGPNITDALGEISMMIENGTDPNEIMTMLVEQGVSEDEASSIINSAMTEVQEDDIEEEDADLDAEDIEPDSPVEDEEEFDDSYAALFDDESGEMKYGGIKIDPSKKGTFKAQATKMGMSVQDAAQYILDNKEEYSPAMVKKANFAKNFAKEMGGQMYEMAAGGTVPERYKNMGFTKVGVKKQSTRPGKKWMVLAKKGDKYKVVHGGWKGMQDFKQHGSEERKDRFWDRMGGKDSAKAKDPFSPLYWHKKFGTWAEGGEPQNEGFQALPDAVKAKILENMKYDNGGESMYNYADYVSGDVRTNKTEKGTINSLENNAVNRGLAMANTLGDPRMMMWSLPNKGILGAIKGVAGAAAGLSGAALGYSKLFSDGKSNDYITNAETKESGKMEDVLEKRRQDNLMKQYSSPEFYQDSPLDEKRRKDGMFPSGPVGPGFFDGDLPTNSSTEMMARYGGSMKRKYQDGGTFKDWFIKNSTRPDVMQNVADQAKLEEMWKAETAQQQPVVANTAGPAAEVATSVGNTEVAQTPGGANPPGQTSPTANKFSYTNKGDSIGVVAANNALAGLGMVNQVLDAKDYQKEYEQRMREIGNTMNRYNPQNAVNPFGNYTLNAGPASNFGLVANTPIQDFGTKMSSAKFGGLIPFIPATRGYQEGGEYYADEDEIKRILAMGGEIEFID